jgi:hypothetical protein
MNNRYQKRTKPEGATRKSASSVKPTKKASPAKSATPAKRGFFDRFRKGGTAVNKPKVDRSYLAAVPDTPEYKSLRKRWWICLGVAVVLLLMSLFVPGSFGTQVLGLSKQMATNISMGFSWVALAVVAYSWWLDFKKIRPLIKQAQQKAKRDLESK